jgi:hypothetical protein
LNAGVVRRSAYWTADSASMYGLTGAHCAMATAPDTPNSATARGPMQHKPMKEATALKPMAPPVVVATVFFSFIGVTRAAASANLDRRAVDAAVGAVDAAVARFGLQSMS